MENGDSDEIQQNCKFLKDISEECSTWESRPVRDRLISRIIEYINQYYDDLPNRAPVENIESSEAAEYTNMTLQQEFDLQEEPCDIEDILRIFKRYIDEKGYNITSSGFYGYVNSSGNYVSSLATFLCTVVQRFTGHSMAHPEACALEYKMIRWVADLVGFPRTACGNFTSGASAGTVLCFTAARDAMLSEPADYSRAVVYSCELIHSCHAKALRVVGLGRGHHRYISLTKDMKVDVLRMHMMIRKDKQDGLIPFMVVGILGDSSIGYIDPMEELASVAKQHNLWFHVDAAYGGFFLMLESVKEQCKGVQQCDSIVMDCYKTLFQPFGISVCVVKNGMLLNEAIAPTRSMYILNEDIGDAAYSPQDYSFELSRPFRAFPLWFSLRLFGTEFIRKQLDEKLILARLFHQLVQDIQGIRVGPTPRLSCVVFWVEDEELDSDDATKQLHSLILKDRRIFLSLDRYDSRVVIHYLNTSFRSHIRELHICIDVISEKTKALLSKLADKTTSKDSKRSK